MGSVSSFPAGKGEGSPPAAGPRQDAEESAFLFRLVDRHQYALSHDASGLSLPRGVPGFCAWVFVRPVNLIAGEYRVEFDSDEVIRSLHNDGYVLVGNLFETRQ